MGDSSGVFAFRADRVRGRDRCKNPPPNPVVEDERARRIRLYVELRERGEPLCVGEDEDLRRRDDE